MKVFKITFLSILYLGLLPLFVVAQTGDKSDWVAGVPDACTSITLGKLATTDGSVITSHTDDSHRTRSWIDIVPPKVHPNGET